MKYENYEKACQVIDEIRMHEQELKDLTIGRPLVRVSGERGPIYELFVGGDNFINARAEAMLEGIKTDLKNTIENLKRELEEL